MNLNFFFAIIQNYIDFNGIFAWFLLNFSSQTQFNQHSHQIHEYDNTRLGHPKVEICDDNTIDLSEETIMLESDDGADCGFTPTVEKADSIEFKSVKEEIVIDEECIKPIKNEIKPEHSKMMQMQNELDEVILVDDDSDDDIKPIIEKPDDRGSESVKEEIVEDDAEYVKAVKSELNVFDISGTQNGSEQNMTTQMHHEFYETTLDKVDNTESNGVTEKNSSRMCTTN